MEWMEDYIIVQGKLFIAVKPFHSWRYQSEISPNNIITLLSRIVRRDPKDKKEPLFNSHQILKAEKIRNAYLNPDSTILDITTIYC